MKQQVLDSLEFSKVLGFISNYASTEIAKEIILNKKPSTDIDFIRREGSLVNDAKNIIINNDEPPINYLQDLYKTISKTSIEGSFLQTKEILEIYKLLVISRKLNAFFKNLKEEYNISKIYTEQLLVDKMLEHHITSTMDEDGNIRSNASKKLREIRNDIRDKQELLDKVIKKLLKNFADSYFVQEEYVTRKDGRIVVPVKAEHKRQVNGFIHGESSTGQTVYIEPHETLELNNELLSLSFAEKREIESILRQLTKKISENKETLKYTLRAVSEIDAYFAAAKYSIEIMGNFPEIVNNGNLEIIEGRHPLLLKKIGRDKTIPLNLSINESNRIVVITGPNAGGKTVVLKTTGLLTALALCGFHIPIHSDSKINLFNQILIDIGDKQSLEDDLSTFSSHLNNIKDIIESSDSKSLILIDEIGTGTDPSEGAALAQSILLELYKKKASVLVTTHHGNLKIYANEYEGFENASMEFDSEDLIPTYRFRQGFPGASYAFEVAERIGIEKKIITEARNYLDGTKTKVEDLLLDLEKKTNQLSEKLKNAEIENIRLKGLTNLYKEKVDTLEKKKNEIIKKAKEDADFYLRDVNKKVEQAIQKIKESQASKDVIREEKKSIEELKQKNEDLIQKSFDKVNDKKDFNVGDFVKIKDTTADGIIIEIDTNKSRAIVNSGNIKLQVKLKDLIHSKKSEKIEERPEHLYDSLLPSYRLDIRGYRAEEAEFEIIKFLDQAYSGGIEQVEILHGKGTGALKKTVHEILNQHDKVKNYYFAKIELGGEGITIVEFKN
jgi:DNA mismatch repair protein MutS2